MHAISVVNHGVSNLKSVVNIIEKTGSKSNTVSSADELRNFDKLIIPGVGNFSEAVSNLRDAGLWTGLLNYINNKDKFILGICFGMQLLCLHSYEGGI